MKKFFCFLFLLFVINIINAQNTKLDLTLSTGSTSICSGEFMVTVRVENLSSVMATDVRCKMNLPSYISFVNPSDTVIVFEEIEEDDWMVANIYLRNAGSFTSSSYIPIKAQITDCDQADAEGLQYGQWDWTGEPNRLGSIVHVPVGLVMSLRDIQVESSKICKGDTATLTATASSNFTYPQKFVWYSQDLKTIVHREEIYSGSSTYRIPDCNNSTNFYVTVSDRNYCPIMLPYQYREVLLNQETNQRSTTVGHDDCINFYDEGGKDANYTAGTREWVHTFRAESENDPLYVSFDMLGLSLSDVLYIYNGPSTNSPLLYTLTSSSSLVSFQSPGPILTFKFVQQGGVGMGWSASIKAKSDAKLVSVIRLNAANDRGMFLLSNLDSVLLYDDDGGAGGLYQTGDNSYTFTSMLGNVKADFSGYALDIGAGDTLFVYDGDNTESSLLATYTNKMIIYSQNTEKITSTGQSMTIRLKATVGNRMGFRAKVTMVNMEASFGKATVTIKAPGNSSSLIQTTDDEVCYGSTAKLMASADIQYPQYYTWYASDKKTIIQQHTIYSGSDTLTVLPAEESTYYVAVTNDTMCPLDETVHDNYREVYLDGTQTYINIAANDIIGFYDEGGPNGNYSATSQYRYCSFNAPSGSHIRIHFNRVQLDANNNAYIYMEKRINTPTGTQYEYEYIRGNQTNLDYFIEGNLVNIYFYNYSGQAYPGWDAYIYAITPIDTSIMAKAKVRIKTPVPSNSITTTGAEVCYGTEATLTASSTIGYPQTFVWYGPDRRSELKRETIQNGSSTLTVTPAAEETYYVKVTNEENCPIVGDVHNHYREIRLSGRESSYYISAGDSIGFFDDGGPNGYYDASTQSRYCTFNAPSGSHIRIHFNNVELDANNNAYIRLYKRINTTSVTQYENEYIRGRHTNLDYVVEGNYVEVYFYNSAGQSHPGWDAYIYAITPVSTENMASANVRFKSPVSPNSITTTGAEVCYGSEATLRASSTIAYPQTYVWYGSDKISELKRETIQNGSSTLTVTPAEEETYYVRVTNEENCPIVGNVHNRYREVRMSGSNGGNNSYYISIGDSIGFFDDGGPNSNYSQYQSRYCYFSAPENSHIRIHFNNVQLDANNNAYIRLYKRINTTSGTQYEYEYIRGNQTDLDRIIEGNYVEVYFYDQTGQTYPGWDAYIYAITPVSTGNMASANVRFKSPVSQESISTIDDEVCYGSEATLRASSTIAYPQTFVWYSPDRMSIVKEERVDEGGSSSLVVIPTAEETYYVAVTNANNCPILDAFRPNYREIRLDGDHNGSNYFIASGDSIGFYDAGGPNGNYETSTSRSCSFNAPEGSYIRLHFNRVQLDANNNAYIRLYGPVNTPTGIQYQYTYIRGNQTDKDYIIEGNNVDIYFYNNSSQTNAGWEAFLYAIKPKDVSKLSSVNVSFMEPVISQTLSVNSEEVCYGDTVMLTATNGGGIYHYVWYDEDYHIVKEDTAEQSSMEVVATLDTIHYYVTAGTGEECVILPPDYGELWFNRSMDGKTTNLVKGQAIPFYDAGGPDANYNTPGANWTHTFRAPAGRWVTLKLNNFNTGYNHSLSIYDGSLNNLLRSYSGGIGNLNATYTASTLIVRWVVNANSNNFNYRGWDALVGVTDDHGNMSVRNNIPSAMVTIKPPVSPDRITTTGDEICYGSEATLTASSTIDFPQTFVWYAPDRMSELKRETIQSGSSSLTVTPIEETPYYVAVTNNYNCPIEGKRHSNYREIWMDGTQNSITIAPNDSIGFFDAGGPNENYYPNQSYSYTFTAPEGSYIRIHFNQIYLDANQNAYIRINGRMGTSTRDEYLYKIKTNVDYIIEDNRVNIYFQNSSSQTSPGWEGYIYAIETQDTAKLAKANVKFYTVPSEEITVTGAEICYGSEATLTASSTIDHPQFIWYSSDRFTIEKNERPESGISTLTKTPTEEETYYVEVIDRDQCPLVQEMHPNYREVLLDASGDGRTFIISKGDSIGFYDAGGRSGNYEMRQNRYCTFIAPEGSHIRLHFNNVRLDANQNARIRIEKRLNTATGYDYQQSYIYGNRTNLDYIIEGNYVRIYFDNYSDQTFAGWEAYLYAIMPREEDKLTAAEISFANPVISQTITANDPAAVCIGETVTLTASNGNGASHYAWYDEAFRLLQEGTESSYDVLVASDSAYYYVMAGGANECLMLPPNYGQFWFDASKDGGTTILSEGEAIEFYDAGGVDANYYTPGADWTHTFVAPENKQVTLQLSYFYTNCGHRLYIYDGTRDNYTNSYSFDCSYGNMNRTITSTTGKLTIRWYIDNNPNSFGYPGWEGLVGVKDNSGNMRVDNGLASVKVTGRPVVAANEIRTTGAEVCYGSEATLTASSDLEYPQNYTWFAPDRITVLKRETIYQGVSELKVVPSEATNYYVSVSNNDHCGVVGTIHNNYREVLLDGSQTSITLAANDSIGFYDAGGRTGNYEPNISRSCTFTAPEGSHIRIHFNNVNLGTNGNTYIELYERFNTPTGTQYQYEYIRGNQTNQDYLIEGNYVQIYFYSYDSYSEQTFSGWDAYIYAITPIPAENLASANVRFKPQVFPNITTTGDEICYGSEATLTASSTLPFPQTFVWYSPDRTSILKQERIEGSGSSTLTVTPTREESYYVVVTNDANCPIVEQIHTHFREVRMRGRSDNSYIISEGDSICFYDSGGPNGNSEAQYGYCAFNAPSGSHIRLHFNRVQLDANQNAYIQIRERVNTPTGYEYQYRYIRGNQTNLDYIIEGNYVQIYFYPYSSSQTYPGWDAYLYAIKPESMYNMTSAEVRFKTPVSQSTISTTGDAICYGDEASLTASSTIDYPQTYVWYSPDRMSVVKRETVTQQGGYSTLLTTPTTEEPYYVAVTNNCPIVENVHSNYREILLNENGHESTYFIDVEDSIGFYDAGGRTGNYEQNKYRYCYFRAPEGSYIRLHFNQVRLDANGNDYIRLYERINTTTEEVYQYEYIRGNHTNLDYLIKGNYLEVEFYGSNQANPGWEAYMYVVMPKDTGNMASANVRFLSVSPENVTASGDEVCFGSEATLMANSMIGYPQTYVWYAPDKISVIKRDIVQTQDDVSTLVVNPTEEATYYVAVTNDNNCSIREEIHPNYREVLLNENGSRYFLFAGDSVGFYDAGGRTGNYEPSRSRNCSFYAPEGSFIRIHFNRVQLDANNNAYIRLTKRINTSTGQVNQTEYIRGSQTDLDYIVEGNYLQIEFNNNNSQTNSGWEAYVYAMLPKNTNELTPARVSFVDPVISQTVSVDDVEACRGETATLIATNGDGASHYAWYDENYRLLMEETGESSSLEVPVATNTTYYVTAGGTEECPIRFPHYGELWFDATMDGGTTNLNTGEAIPFYDAGGPDEYYYTPGADYIHTFIAPAGKQVTLQLNYFYANCGHNLYIYDGTQDNSFATYSYDCNRGKMNTTITSVSGMLTVRWQINYNSNSYNYPGFEALVGVRDDNGEMNLRKDMKSANVTVKSMTSVGGITTTDAEVCYGDPATLTASSNIAYPQYYTWFSPDRLSILKLDTVTAEGGISELTGLPGIEKTYYVAVSNQDNCPIVGHPHTNYKEVLLNGNGSVYAISAGDSIGFFDAGGRTGNYEQNRCRNGFFNAPTGSKIRIHFNSVQVDYGYMYIYDLTNTNQTGSDNQIAYINGEQENLDYVVDGNKIRIEFCSYNDVTSAGWDAYIYAITPFDEEMPEVRLTEDQNGQTTTVREGAPIHFSDNGGESRKYSSNAHWTHTFVAAEEGQQVLLQVSSFESESSYDYLEIHDGSSISSITLGTLTGTYSSNIEYTSTNGSLTVLWHSDASIVKQGWSSTVKIVGDESVRLPNAKVKIKAVSPESITVSGNEICYGEEATLAVSSTIAYPQTFTWFNPDRMSVLKEETVEENGGSSTLTLTPTEEETYYVAVTNSETCPIVQGLHHNYREIWLNTNGTTYNIAAGDSIGFYDEGGPYANYESNQSRYCYFTAPQGSKIRIHFDRVELDANSQIQIEKRIPTGTGYNWSYEYIRGSGVQTDLDYIIESNYVEIYFSASNRRPRSGWEGYIYAITPVAEEYLTAVPVSFATPVISQNIFVNDAEACMGETIPLVATNGNGISRYVWYDEDYRQLQDTIGESSTLNVMVTDNTTYYVMAGDTDECLVLPPHYGEFWFDASKDGGTTILTEGKAIPFYDAGGPTAIYNTPDANWTHTFVAPAGKQVTLKLNNFNTNCSHRLYIYDGTYGNSYHTYSYDCNEGNLNETITSTTGRLTVRWYIAGSPYDFYYNGWDGMVGVKDDSGNMRVDKGLKSVNVTLKSMLVANNLTTTDDFVCLGEEARLTASSDIAYPQYYTWFSPDRMSILKRDTVTEAGDVSELTGLPGLEETYYVAVSNNQTCPIAGNLHSHYVEFLLDGRQTEYTLSSNDSIGFFDEGGPDGDFTPSMMSRYCYFNAPAGSKIRVHFNSVQMGGGYLYIYDYSNSMNSTQIAYISGNQENLDYVINGTRIEIYAYGSGGTSPGWDGYIYVITPYDIPMPELMLNAETSGGTTHVERGQSIRFYDDGGPSGNYSRDADWTHTFVAEGSDQVTLDISSFQSESCCDYMAIYDGPSTSSPLLRELYGSYTNLSFTSTNGSLTVYWYEDGGSLYSGWSGTVKIEGDEASGLPKAKVMYKAVSPSAVTATGAEVCYGADATLSASSTIKFPQRYVWFSPDRMSVLRRDTIYSGVSTYSMTPESETTYYVAVSCDTTCPIVSGYRPNYREILMDGSQSTITLAGTDSIAFFDAGGRENAHNGTAVSYIFNAPEGSKIKIHINRASMGSMSWLYVYDRNSTTIANISGTQEDLDYLVDDNYVRIQFSMMISSGADNWEGYLYAVSPPSLSTLTAVDVRFREPSISSLAQVEDKEDCYGYFVDLNAQTAASAVPYPQQYAWYDSEMILLKLEQVESGSSTLNVQVTGEYTYYVNVSGGSECPTLPPGYLELRMDANVNGGQTIIREGHPIYFYDDGGPAGDYSRDADWTHTFVSENGHPITIEFENFYTCTYSHYLTIYDGSSTGSSTMGNLRNSDYEDSYTSYGDALTVSWKSPSNIMSTCVGSGWKAVVKIAGDNSDPYESLDMSEARVSVKTVSSSSIAAPAVSVCYGDDATLRASSTMQYPQFYTWYSPDRMSVVHQDTINSGESSYTLTPESEATYYVAVSCDTTCPIIVPVHNHYREVLMAGQTTYNLSETDSVVFFDAGGAEGDHDGSSPSCIFNAPEGSKIKVHINRISIGAMIGILSLNDRNGNQIVSISTSQENLDYLVDDNYVKIQFALMPSGADNWEGYLYAMTPPVLSTLTAVDVRFREPSMSSLAQVNNAEACYGDSVALIAQTNESDVAFPQRYAWYDSDMNLLQQEQIESGNSTLNVQVTGDASYYVNVSSGNECATLPPGYLELRLDENANGNTTIIQEGHPIYFYDDGGPAGNYSLNANWTHTFVSENGNPLVIEFENFYTCSGSHYMYIFNGYNVGGSQLGNLYNSYYNQRYTSYGDAMTVSWMSPGYNGMINCVGSGWKAVVRVLGDNTEPSEGLNVSEVRVTRKLPPLAEMVTTRGDTVCYGSEATLTANISVDYPQYYTWYAPDGFTIIKHETIYSGQSSLTVVSEAAETYYVAVSNDTTCPVVETVHDNYREVLLNSSGSTYDLSVTDSVGFFDRGGKYGDVNSTGSWSCYFNVPEGSYIKLHFDEIDLGTGTSSEINIYGRNSTSIATLTGVHENLDYLIRDNYVQVSFYINSGAVPGWSGYIYALNNPNTEAMAPVNADIKVDISQLAQTTDTLGCYGELVKLKASVPASELAYPQRYAWYDSGMHLLKQEDISSGYSSLELLASAEESYFVNVTGENGCPVIPSGYGALILNERTNNQTTIVREGQPFYFYDEGGRDGNYTTKNVNWNHTFVSAEDNRQISLKLLLFDTEDEEMSDCGYLGIGNVESYGLSCYSPERTFTSTEGILRVDWQPYSSTAPGWAIIVSLEGDESEPLDVTTLPEAHVGLRNASPDIITTTDAMVCYGSEATLTATADVAYPQYYTWYDTDRMTVLHHDTVQSGLVSHLSVATTEASTYYVAVTNDTMCPMVSPVHSHYREVVMDGAQSAHTLYSNEKVGFFDGGGANGVYEGIMDKEYVFTMASAGYSIRVHLDTVALGSHTILRIYDREEGTQYAFLSGTMNASGLDYVIPAENRSVRIRFTTEGTASTADWSGYICAVLPQNPDLLAEASVDFRTAAINNTIVADSVTACYGEEIVLTAHTDSVPYPQYYAWYDGDKNILKQELVQSGDASLEVTAESDMTYYVNVSAEDACPTVTPDAGALLLNASTAGQTTIIREGHPLAFFDDGGVYGDYSSTNGMSWSHTFTAEPGKQVELKFLSYDVAESGASMIVVYEIMPGMMTMTIVPNHSTNVSYSAMSSGGSVSVMWSASSPGSGWNAEVRIVGDNTPVGDLTPVTVTIGRPAEDETLAVTGDTICAGGGAVLTASSAISGVRYYDWYNDASQELVYRDTVTSGMSTLFFDEPTETAVYYVSAHGAGECPVSRFERSAETELYLNTASNNQTTVLGRGDRVHFYDDGGPTDNYSADANYTHTFTTDDNHYIAYTINSGMGINSQGSVLYLGSDNQGVVYTGAEGDLAGQRRTLSSHNLTVTLQANGVTGQGWDMTIFTVPVSATTPTVTLDDAHNNDTTVLHLADEYLFTDAGGATGSYLMTSGTSYTHTFMVDQGVVAADFNMADGNGSYLNLGESDTLYVYDSDSSLISKFNGDVLQARSFQSTGKSMSFRFVTSNVLATGRGWMATIRPAFDTIGTPFAMLKVLENSAFYDTVYLTSLPYTWYDTTFQTGTESGDYFYHLVNAVGCDSLMQVRLIVLCEPYVNPDTIDMEVCASSVTLGGHTYTESGQYDIVYTAVSGCDSTVTTNLVLNHPDNTGYQFMVSCPEDVYDTIRVNRCTVAPTLGEPNFVHHAMSVIPTYADSIVIANDAPAEFYEGDTVVRWTVSDACGHSVECEQGIHIAMEPCPLAVDYDGNEYPSIRLGDNCKCWTTKNLKSVHYSDGREIEGAMSYYSYEFPNTSLNVEIYGRLYDWYSAADTQRYGSVDSVERAYNLGRHIQGVCPAGWYLPSDEEYEELNIYPTTDLRSTSYWLNVVGTVNTNATEFNALPGGKYNCETGRFEEMTGNAYYWSCHPVYDMATGAMIDFVCEKILVNDNSRCNGYSIRCILLSE